MTPRFQRYILALFASLCILVTIYFSIEDYLWNIPQQFIYSKEEDFIQTLTSQNGEYQQIADRIYDTNSITNKDSCILPKIDPWDVEIKRKFPDLTNPEVRKYIYKMKNDPIIEKSFEWMSFLFDEYECKPTFNKMTSLENGLLQITENYNRSFCPSPECYFKCLYALNEGKMKEDDWQLIDNVGVRPNCDIVETKCLNCNDYHFIHTQIVERTKPILTKSNNLPPNPSKFNFYWLIVDSTSHSASKRTLRKTLDFLLNKMEAIEFPYLNKVGLNSQPNSHALFFGEETLTTHGFYFSKTNKTDDKPKEKTRDLCYEYLDELNFVGFDFKNSGYRTMMTEDWFAGVLHYGGCFGFKYPPVDHFTRPFWLKVGMSATKEYKEEAAKSQMFKKSCKNRYNYTLEHMRQFSEAYPNKPKFGVSWNSYAVHEDNTFLFGLDQLFADFFEDLDKKSENSFIFFQADHGLRFGPVRDIPAIGPIEDNNPFFYVVVPKILRENPSFMSQIKENSKHLVSHFDIYASAVQVAKFSANWTPQTQFNTKPEPITDRKLLGSSIFHQMKQPRNCATLNIPWEYCNCYVKKVGVNDVELSKRVAQVIIDFLNDRVNASEYKELCSKHTLDLKFPISLEESILNNKESRTFTAKFQTLPGRALYQAVVELKNDGSFALKQYWIPRLNMYQGQADCIPYSFLKNHCVCKDIVHLLNKN